MLNLHNVQGDVAYETRLLDRLREQYLQQTPLPTNEGTPLTVDAFYRLYVPSWLKATAKT